MACRSARSWVAPTVHAPGGEEVWRSDLAVVRFAPCSAFTRSSVTHGLGCIRRLLSADSSVLLFLHFALRVLPAPRLWGCASPTWRRNLAQQRLERLPLR